MGGDNLEVPGICQESCESENCYTYDTEGKGDRTRCDNAAGCIWNDNHGQCEDECGTDNCWSCNGGLSGDATVNLCIAATGRVRNVANGECGPRNCYQRNVDIYGGEAKGMCADAGCQVAD